MVMSVEAGAVADASAARMIENAIPSFRIKKHSTNTSTVASSASNSVMTTTLLPFFFSVEKRKYSPTLNAINASAMSEMKSMPSTT